MAIILFCLTGIASMMGWIPDVSKTLETPIAYKIVSVPDDELSQVECTNCGVIAATCVLDTSDDEGYLAGLVNASGVLGPGLVEAVSGEKPPVSHEKVVRHYQTTVRFNNGTTRAFASKAEPQWQVGTRVRVTEGIILPQS